MSELQSFRVFLNQRLAAAALEIFGAVEQTVKIYHEENQQLRRLLQITPEVNLPTRDSIQFSVSEEEIPSEQQHCEQEWSPSLGQEDPEPTQIKEEREELWISQVEEQLQGVEDYNMEVQFTPPGVKSEGDQEDPIKTLALPQTQTVENRLHDPKKVHLSPFVTYEIPCNHPAYQSRDSHHRSTIISDAGGLDTLPLDPRQPLDPNPAIYKDCSKSTSRTFRCDDCGKKFIRKQHLATHILTHTDSLDFSLSVSQEEVPPEQQYYLALPVTHQETVTLTANTALE
ncbi:hypothetical protein UPYG_G00349910 [Umbra pygmaea]|uniref:C2H2-type domain-containing protein n=1 Tax=Umbra pygmaea TaxID=75934 RepID=A0ABD0VXZ7_UMBPY